MYSTSSLRGALVRSDDGTWRWRASGLPAPQVRDGKLAKILPRFPMLRVHGVAFIGIPDDWTGAELDPMTRVIVLWAKKHGTPGRIPKTIRTTDTFAAPRTETVPGTLLRLDRWRAVGRIPFPQWDDRDAEAVFEAAQREWQLMLFDDLEAAIARTAKRFYHANAQAEWGDPERAARQWAIVEARIRESYADPLWFARAEATAWRWHPEPARLLAMTRAELESFADAYGVIA